MTDTLLDTPSPPAPEAASTDIIGHALAESR
jgi:hypothetical protein